jgi:hypothetical protein
MAVLRLLTRNLAQTLVGMMLVAGLLSSVAVLDAHFDQHLIAGCEAYGAGSSVTINDVSVTEGDAGTTNAVFTVTAELCGGQYGSDGGSVSFATADGASCGGCTPAATAPADYASQSGLLTFACCGTQVQTITVPVVGDTAAEGNEYFHVLLSNPVGLDITDDTGVGTIIDNERTLTVVSPNGGETWPGGSPQTISWTWSGPLTGSVRIDLLQAGHVVRTITPSTPLGANGSGNYLWNVPSDIATGAYAVRVVSGSAKGISDTSNASFTILNPRLTVQVPNGGEAWKRGTVHTISWTYTGSPGPDVRIRLLLNGNVVATIVASTPIGAAGQGQYQWTIPTSLAVGKTYTISIDAPATGVADVSDHVFRIS